MLCLLILLSLFETLHTQIDNCLYPVQSKFLSNRNLTAMSDIKQVSSTAFIFSSSSRTFYVDSRSYIVDGISIATPSIEVTKYTKVEVFKIQVTSGEVDRFVALYENTLLLVRTNLTSIINESIIAQNVVTFCQNIVDDMITLVTLFTNSSASLITANCLVVECLPETVWE